MPLFKKKAKKTKFTHFPQTAPIKFEHVHKVTLDAEMGVIKGLPSEFAGKITLDNLEYFQQLLEI